MASKLCCSSFTKFLILLIVSVMCSLSLADDPPTICKLTPHYSYCESVLPTGNSSANVRDYGRFCVKKSSSDAAEILSLIQMYLRKSSDLSNTAILALEDCELLIQLNLDFLSSSFQTMNSATTTLPTLQAEDVQTWLSAILTNTQTCSDGLQDAALAWSVNTGLHASLSNNSMLHSVSLALFSNGWLHNERKLPSFPNKRLLLNFRNGLLPLRMSPRNQEIYEKLSGRKLLQTNNQVQVNKMVTVSKDGSGNYTTISAAVAAAPSKLNGATGYFLIYITAGLYQEYVSISSSQRYIMMIGAGINQTVITGNHSVADGWTTFRSPTFAVTGEGFVAVNITFQNTAGAIKNQAVAVRSGADLSTFYKCSFEGYQDTLYTYSLRQFYRECDIYGTVDFIFGNSAVVFQNCNIYPRQPLNSQFNTITAQGRTDPNQNTGISIQNGFITPASDLASSNYTVQTYLGRPWKNYSRTVFMESFMDSFINPAGWSEWSGTFALATLYYAEFNNTGPGSNTANRVTWPGYHIINATDANNFTVSNFISGDAWLPQTEVPYTSGLI